MGRPWVGPAGDVLRKEMARVGISMDTCRLSNLWLHDKVNDTTELDWHLKQLMVELKRAKAVLMMGSDVANLFLELPVSDVTGLQVHSSLLPKNIQIAVASLNPAVVLQDNGAVGEVRLAVQNFARLVEGLR